jgi:lysophospholipase L1-like esterase
VSVTAEALDPWCLREGEARRLLRGHPWRRFVVMGDSIAEGLGDPSPGYPDQPWCDRIAHELSLARPGLAYRNLGVRDTPAAEVARSQLPLALEFRPDLALAACGGYDLLGFSYDAEAVQARVREIVAALSHAGAQVITVGPFDRSRAPGVPAAYGRRLGERLQDFGRRLAAIAAEFGTLHVELTSHPASSQPDLYSGDARHGTMRGHAIAAAEAIRRLAAHLDATGREAAP